MEMEKLNSYAICELDNGSFVIQTTEYDGINDDTPDRLRDALGETEFVTYPQAVVVLAKYLLSQIA
jgi:folate-dependent phosphoribosylglycinamide formyltransferase PurN